LLGSTDSFKKQLLRGGLGSFGLKLLSMLLAFLLSVLLARVLDPGDLGIYSFAYALIMMIAIPAQMGLPQLVIRETAVTQAQKKWTDLRGLWHWSTMVACLFSAVSVLVVIVVLIFYKTDLSPQKYKVLLWALPLIPLITLGNIRGAALKGLRHVVLGQLPESILRPALLLLSILMLILVLPDIDIDAVNTMTAHVVASLGAFIVGAYFLWKFRPEELILCSGVTYRSKFWLSAAFPLAFISGVQFIVGHTDILMLGLLRSDDEVAIYRIAAQVSLLISFGPQVLNVLLAPYIAKFCAQEDKNKLRKIVKISVLLGFFSTLLLALILAMFGKLFFSSVFGYVYQSSYFPSLILAGGFVLNAGFGPVGMILQMAGYEKEALIGVSVAAVLNIGLNLFLIPFYGTSGAAFSTAVSLAISHGILLFFVIKLLGLNSSIGSIFFEKA